MMLVSLHIVHPTEREGSYVLSYSSLLRHSSIDLIHERVIVRLRHSFPDGKLQKEERALFYSRIAVNVGKKRRVQ